jgi:exonuclease 3'-5' domain-containing protein 1
LFSLFRISVDGIKDLQLMEPAYRTGPREFVSGLAKCIEKESPISAAAKTEWSLTKECSHRLFAPEKGGRYEVFNERPPKPEITEYCKQDVVLLPGLYDVYNTKLRQPGQAFWRVHVRETTKDRIKLSQSLGYDGKSKGNALGWNDQTIEEEIESWNEEIMMEASAGEYVLNENDEWVPAPNDDLDFFVDEEEEQDDEEDWGDDTARDCIGWEEDMIKNGEF